MTTAPRYPAFKEWQVIVAALAAGEQSLLLRKGGIAESRGKFNPERAERFWLFPTQFHAQREKTKQWLAQRLNSVPGEPRQERPKAENNKGGLGEESAFGLT